MKTHTQATPLKVRLVPGWLERKLKAAGMAIESVAHQEKLSSILSPADLAFYHNQQYGVITALYGSGVADSFAWDTDTSPHTSAEDVRTMLLGGVYKYDTTASTDGIAFKAILTNDDLVVLVQTSESSHCVVDRLMELLDSVMGIASVSKLPIFPVYTAKLAVLQ